jgi:hypothetical protein
VDVDWAKVERVLTGALDADGDGKLTANDARLGLSRLNALLAFNLPGGSGFASGLLFAAGGRAGKLAAVGAAVAAAPTLATAHAYSSSESFRRQLEDVAPGVAAQLAAALAHTGSFAAAAAGAVQRAVAPPLPTLEALRREEKRTRLEARLLADEKKMTPQKRVALQRCEARLLRIEADKRAVKEAEKQAKLQARKR